MTRLVLQWGRTFPACEPYRFALGAWAWEDGEWERGTWEVDAHWRGGNITCGKAARDGDGHSCSWTQSVRVAVVGQEFDVG